MNLSHFSWFPIPHFDAFRENFSQSTDFTWNSFLGYRFGLIAGKVCIRAPTMKHDTSAHGDHRQDRSVKQSEQRQPPSRSFSIHMSHASGCEFR
jgi:hypothetical protein